MKLVFYALRHRACSRGRWRTESTRPPRFPNGPSRRLPKRYAASRPPRPFLTRAGTAVLTLGLILLTVWVLLTLVLPVASVLRTSRAMREASKLQERLAALDAELAGLRERVARLGADDSGAGVRRRAVEAAGRPPVPDAGTAPWPPPVTDDSPAIVLLPHDVEGATASSEPTAPVIPDLATGLPTDNVGRHRVAAAEGIARACPVPAGNRADLAGDADRRALAAVPWASPRSSSA